MPTIKLPGFGLYFETHGEGYPLVLIRGLGSNADHWYSQVPAFSRHFKVVVFDNRGIARSGMPEDTYSILAMAHDTVCLLDALGIARAHILGLSLGGMVAQEVALHHPQRVNGLVLACTHCGGARVIRHAEATAAIKPEDLYAGSPEKSQSALQLLFAPQTLQREPEVVEKYLAVSAQYPPSAEVLRKQREAVEHYDSWPDLPRIAAPTLVISGSQDVLVPPANSEVLAQRIAGARLELVAGGGHQFMIEKYEASNRIILGFLEGLTI